MKNLNRLTVLLALAAVFSFQQPVAAQPRLRDSVIGNGSGRAANSDHRVVSTIGQPAVGHASNELYTMGGGFLNTVGGPAPPPSSWAFTGNTGNNANIVIPIAIDPSIGSEPLQTGDAVGVFFSRDGSLFSAGFSIWQAGQNMAITAWGDDSQTDEQDGFAEGELIRYKIWDASAEMEYDAEVTYESGGTAYTANGIYVLSSLTGLTTVSHSLALAPGWNMISSFVEPADPALETLLAAITPQLRIMKNGAGQVFWPEFSINTIGEWNARDGYQVNMISAAAFDVTGIPVVPEAAPISLAGGWSLFAYLRSGALNIETALASLGNKIVIVKNNAGQVYWPEFSINSIGDMAPGQGYQIFLSQAATLTYPANSSSAAVSALPNSRMVAGPRHYARAAFNTGANATLLVTSPELNDGDEIAVWTADKMLVGVGAVRNGKAVIPIWGNNRTGEAERVGAIEGEALSLTLWQVSEQNETPLALSMLTNGLNGEALDHTLRFRIDAVWVANVAAAKYLPTEFTLAQNYPNPFNPSTVIKYGLPHEAKVTLEVYDLLGRRVAVLVDEQQNAGFHQVVFEDRSLANGVYFYRLRAGRFTQSFKMLLVR